MTAPGVLIIGASQWKYASDYAHLFPGFEISIISKSGMRVDEVDEGMILATEFFNDVVLHLGTNNLIVGQSPEDIIKMHEDLIKDIQARNPNVRLYLSSVLFRSESRFRQSTRFECDRIHRLNSLTRQLNQYLLDLSVKYNAYFIDNWRKFEESSASPKKELLSRDGLHLSPKGIQCLMGNVVLFILSVHHFFRLLPRVKTPIRPGSSASFPSPLIKEERPLHCYRGTFSEIVRSSLSVRSVPQSQFSSSNPSLTLGIDKAPKISSKSLAAQWKNISTPNTLFHKEKSHLNNSFSSIPLSNRWSILDSLAQYSDAYQYFSNSESSSHITSKSRKRILKSTSKQSKNHTKPTKHLQQRKLLLENSSLTKEQSPSNSQLLLTRKEKHTSRIPLKSFNKVFCQGQSSSQVSLISTRCPPFHENVCKYVNNSTNGGLAKQADSVKSLYPRRCEKCNKMYSCKSSFCRHKKICGKGDDLVYPRVCSECHVSYSNKFSYSKHKKHCGKSNSHYIRCPLPDCGTKFQTHSVMVEHLLNEHKEGIDVEEHLFKDMSEFVNWKRILCQKNHISLVKHLGKFLNADTQIVYLICKFNNRRNKSLVNKTSRKRKCGLMPNTDCLARMVVKHSEIGVRVKYYNCHNHDLKFKHVKFYRWDESTKKEINLFLEQGVSAHTVQEFFQPPDLDVENISPIKEHFISSSQINKMKYELNMKKRLSKDDAEAVNLLVHSMKDQNRNSILIYKPQGKPTEIGDPSLDNLHHSSQLFVLGLQQEKQLTEMKSGCTRILCIDSTHGTNQYKFHLLNLVVPDEYGVGYPVAHFITNHLDEETLVFMLQSIKNKCPELTINAIMTDGDEALANAFVKVFGENIRHLLCIWHVKRCWQKNLERKIKNNKVLISEMYENLQIILDEKSEGNFKIMLQAFLHKYSKSANSFITYFEEYYLPKVEKWAMCYRNFTHAATDTNMFVESFHNRLKTHYLNRKVNRRLDDLIDTLFKINRTTHLALVGKRKYEEPPLGFTNLNENRHREGLKIPDADMSTENEGIWIVRSQSDHKLFYKVSRINSECTSPDVCFFKCSNLSCFGLCFHLYHCTCPDRHTLCKHIHKGHSHIVQNHVHPLCGVIKEDHAENSKTYQPSLLDIPPSSKNKQLQHSINQLADRVKVLICHSKTEILLPYLFNSMKLLVDRCEGLIESEQNICKPPSMNYAPLAPNTKITLQQGLFQTVKNKKTLKHKFKKPEFKRREEIKLSLMHNTGKSFTDPIIESTNILATICSVGPFNINTLYLKSLDYYINDNELKILESVSQDFCRGWLYDTVIMAFLHKISNNNSTISLIDPAVSQSILCRESFDDHKSFFNGCNMSGFNKIIIPINPNNSHWMLLVAFPKYKLLTFYDPACEILKDEYYSAISRWANILSYKVGGKITDWSINVPKHNTQKDSYNCGVFVCWYGERIIHGECTRQEFNPNMYRKYIYEVITGIREGRV